MPEVKIEKMTPVKTGEANAGTAFNDLFAPTFPVNRFFGAGPLELLREFNRDMDRMFRGNTALLAPWTPAVDVRRCNGDLVITAELPGLKKEEVKVEMTDEAIVIAGERKTEHKEDHEGYHRYERNYGKFYRAIPLPEGVKTELATAELNEGVLKVTLPLPALTKRTVEVPVTAGAGPAAAATASTA